MHDIEPYFQWRDHYKVEKDPRSPFFDKEYSEFQFTQKIYNYYIHPQWDFFGSETLYLKILFTDYDQGFAIIELIGEWNDAIGNDIMFLKREIADLLINEGITKFVVVCENVLNFHSSDDCYYEEWAQEVGEEFGWICLLNVRPHVFEEMRDTGIDNHCYVLPDTHMVSWRKFKPRNFVEHLQSLLDNLPKWID